MGKKNKKNKGKNKRKKQEEKEEEPEDQEPEEDVHKLMVKFNVRLGPEGYEAAAATKPKCVSIDNYSMMDPAGGRFLLETTGLKINEGVKYGLVGLNGHGKTTLLREIESYQIERFPTHIKILHVKQDQGKDERSVLEAVLEADEIQTQLDSECERLEEMQADESLEDSAIQELTTLLDNLYEMQNDFNSNQGEQLAGKILTGLGFNKGMQNGKVCDLSGGWRMRVALAKALYVEPDLLLLDEPTNHLDFPTVLWLQDYLRAYKKTVILVSHDRTFLNRVCEVMIHLHNKKLAYYKGNYTNMVKVREELRAAQVSQYKKWEVDVRQIEEYVAAFKDKGEKRAKQVQAKLKILGQLKEDPPKLPHEDKSLKFAFPEVGNIPQAVVVMQNVSFRYNPEKQLLQNIDLRLDMGSRIGMLGANGVGKTTLVKLILGELTPQDSDGKPIDEFDEEEKSDDEDGGAKKEKKAQKKKAKKDEGFPDDEEEDEDEEESSSESSSEDEIFVQRNRNCRIALFTQHHMDQLNLDQNPIEFILERFKDDDELKENKDREQYVRRRLGRFHITGPQQITRMKLLSGGQKSRVAFCVCTWLKPHFLIMDEPTNHLDIQIIEVLIKAVEDFTGGVLIISHDQHFLKAVGKQFWSVTPEGIAKFRHFENAKKFALQKRLEQIKVQRVKR